MTAEPRWFASHFKLAWYTGQVRGCGKQGRRGHSGHEVLRNAESHSQPPTDYSLFKRDLLMGLSRVWLSLRDTFAFQKPGPYHARLPVPWRNMGSMAIRQHSQGEEANPCLPTTQLLSLSPASFTGTTPSGEHHARALLSFSDFTADVERMG